MCIYFMNACHKHPAIHFNSVLFLIYMYHLFGKLPSFLGKAIFNSYSGTDRAC